MDKKAADRYIFGYRNKIFGFAMEKMRSIDRAQELASDIIYEVYRSFLRTEDIVNTDGYVYRIACNVYARYIRKLRASRETLSIDEAVIAAPEDTSREEEMYELLRREIGYLSERQRSVIVMHYYDKLSVADIAHRLNISQGTVKWHLSDARTRLKEGINMNCTNNILELNPIIFTDMGHSGSSGSSGDTSDMFDTRLKMNIAWACYHEPKTLEEIARSVGVPQVYAADELKKLVEYAYIDKLDNSKNPKFRTNMIITDGRTEQNVEDLLDKAAEYLCDSFLPAVFEKFEADPRHFGLTCDGDDMNYLRYDLLMLAVRALNININWDKWLVQRPDGGRFTAFAVVQDDISLKRSKKNYPYSACGYMTRSSEEIGYESISVNCRYSDRKIDWRDNLSSDWEELVKFMDGGRDALSPEEYKRLCDKGYLYEDRVQPAVLRTEDADRSFAKIPIEIPENVKEYGEYLDDMIYERNKMSYPVHMQRAFRETVSAGCLGAGTMIPRITEKLLERGVLKPLTDVQRKAVFSVLCIRG